MRTVFRDYNEVAHVWAQQTQYKGESAGKVDGRPRMFFRDSMIFSYGEHFCIARILGTGTVLFTYRNYSPTTTTHKSAVQSAVRGRRVVFCYNPTDQFAHDERERVLQEIAALLHEAATKPRIRQTTRDGLRVKALHMAQRFNDYLAAMQEASPRETALPIDTVNLGSASEEIRRQIAASIERDKSRREERLAVERENLAKWRKHDPAMEYSNFYNIADALRLSKDGTEVQTSRGATIPVAHAKRLWPLIQSVRAAGTALEDRPIRLGYYTLNKIAANGDIVVGCHNIAYAEIEGIALALGLITKELA